MKEKRKKICTYFAIYLEIILWCRIEIEFYDVKKKRRKKPSPILQLDNNPKQGKSSEVNRNSFAMTLSGAWTDLKKTLCYNRNVKNNGQRVAKQSGKIKTDMSGGI